MTYFYIENRIKKFAVKSEFGAPILFTNINDAQDWVVKNREDPTKYSIKKVKLSY